MYIKQTLALSILLLFSITLTAQTPKHSRAKVYANAYELHQLSQAGVCVDHGKVKKGVYLISDFSEQELQVIQNFGLQHEILIDDVTRYYVEQNQQPNQRSNERGGAACTTSSTPTYATPNNFSLGSMGGFFTYAEFIGHIDNMVAQYPNLITAKQAISSYTTTDGKPVYWLRISDNPNTDEAEPEVLYTAVHHAREPASLSHLIMHMWYLLENYSTDPEIQYLVDHTEMYFIPMINPDGYVYNETTNPNGGGMWRKNRRDNGGSFGVDINRNYGYQWGFDDNGSSPNPNADDYRGTAAFSEEETQAVKYFTENREIKLCLNYHTYGNLLIYPWGYGPSLFTPDSALYVEYAKLMTSENSYTYGTGDQTLGYTTNGDTDDWMYGEQMTKDKIISFTPEAGDNSDGFWPNINRIEDICKDNISQDLYAARLVTKYAVVEDEEGGLITQTSGYLNYNITRLGLDEPATYTVTYTPYGAGLASVGSPNSYPGLLLLENKQDSVTYTLDANIQPGQTFSYIVSVNNGLYTFNDTITKVYGQTSVVFADNANNDNNWNTSGSWGVSNSIYYTASGSITDSPTSDYSNNSNTHCTLSNPVDLTSAAAATLKFWARWEIEGGYDYAQVMASADGGNTWTPLCGNYTKIGNSDQDLGQPLYDNFQSDWVLEEVDLSDYLGSTIQIRYRMVSDAFVREDGFYFDDVVVEMIDNSIGVAENNNPLVVLQNMPNPAADYTFVNYQMPAGTQHAALYIYNPVGQLVQTVPVATGSTKTRVNTQGLSNGVYHIQLVTEQYQSTAIRMAVAH